MNQPRASAGEREPVVVDTSSLIALEKIGRLDLLPVLFEPVRAPPAVAREYGSLPPRVVITMLDAPAVADALGISLGRGEAEAIALAAEHGCRVILDDHQARATADRMGVSKIGTVGVLIRAKRAGLISEVRPLLDALDHAGFRLDAALKQRALALAGETT